MRSNIIVSDYKIGEIWTVVLNKSPYINFKIETILQKMKKYWKNYASLGLKLKKTKEINR